MSPAPRDRGPCCVVGCGSVYGRRFVNGYFCDEHRQHAVSVTPQNRADSAQAVAWVKEVTRSATYALRLGVPLDDLREAVEAAQEELSPA